jgi:hypothetical protein
LRGVVVVENHRCLACFGDKELRWLNLAELQGARDRNGRLFDAAKPVMLRVDGRKRS